MKKKTILFTLVVGLFTGCFAPQQTVQTKQTYTFEFTPPVPVKSGSAGFVVGLVKPTYPITFQSSRTELFQNLRKSLGADIEELIISNGFSLKGPYEALDEMIFEDKKRTEMLIQIEIAPAFTAVQGNWRDSYNPLLNTHNYSYSGKASLVGKITLTGKEPLTNEKIWVKSVSIPNIENIAIATTGRYARPLDEIEILEDPGVYNAIGNALQSQYKGIMEKIAIHFNSEEFNSLKSQIKELKSRKGF